MEHSCEIKCCCWGCCTEVGNEYVVHSTSSQLAGLQCPLRREGVSRLYCDKHALEAAKLGFRVVPVSGGGHTQAANV